MDNKEITTLPARDKAIDVFSQSNGLDPYLQHIRAEIDAFPGADVATAKGRKEYAAIAYRVARSKTAIDAMGKELVSELKDLPKKIDAERKRVRNILDAWRDEVRQPLTSWELAEEARIQQHKSAIQKIIDERCIDGLDSASIEQSINRVKKIALGEAWQEFEAEAAREKDKTLGVLESSLATRRQWEADQAELERLRIAKAEAEQREREKRLIRETEERAAREAERKLLEAKLEAERKLLEAKLEAERKLLEEEQRAAKAKEQEKQRIAQQEREERAKREADEYKAHRASIHREILEDLINLAELDDAKAKHIVRLIAKRSIRRLSINY